MKFDSLPQEIIALILQSCDSFRQLQSLILVSKRSCSVWELNTGAILWHVGQAEILGFSDALIAIRATQIAKDALLEGRLPPDPFPVSTLSGDACRPSVAEVIQVQNLQRVAKYLEKAILRDEDLFHCMPDSYDSERHEWAGSRWSFWREQFRHAIYRHIAAGAILYRAYHAPIVSDARPADFLAAFLATMESGEDLNVVADGWFSASDRRYLATVPLYSIQDYHQCEKAFQPLEDLFVEESRKEALLKPPKRLPFRGPKRLPAFPFLVIPVPAHGYF